MNQQIKQRWIKALRSGKYKQGRGKLRKSKNLKSKSSFFCLGVLCDLAVRSKVIPKPKYHAASKTYHYKDGRNDFEGAILPQRVVEWAGVNDPWVFLNEGDYYLTNLNDNGVSFEEIADLIEKHL